MNDTSEIWGTKRRPDEEFVDIVRNMTEVPPFLEIGGNHL
jgi:hypothetical protein